MNTSRNLPDLSIKKIWGKLFKHDNDIEVLQERPVNNNILINSNFANPVNQRGITPSTWERAQYGLDRWILGGIYGISVKSIDANGITISHGTDTGVIIGQKLELSEIDMSSKYTYSVYANGKVRTFTKDLSEFTVGVDKSLATGQDEDRFFLYVAYKPSLGWISFDICAYQENSSFTIKWAKLELGDHATPYVPRLYAEELQLCQRYFKYINVFAGSTFFYLDSNNVRFHVDCGYLMRDIPTVNLNTCAVLKNGNVVSGFSFDILEARNNCDKCILYISCTKSSHGLQVSNLITLGNSIVLDAEL